MVRNYKPKGLKSYKKTDPQKLKQAIEDVSAKKLTFREAALKYDISFSVIYRHAKKGNLIKPQGGQTVLSKKTETCWFEGSSFVPSGGFPLTLGCCVLL